MTAIVENDLEAFVRFAREQLAGGECRPTLEECLALWRERAATVEAIREGLDDARTGRVYPVEQVVRELHDELDSRDEA